MPVNINLPVILTIVVAASITFCLRTFPAFFKSIRKLQNYPKFIKFLDYTICFITGEVIYNAAFGDIPANKETIPLYILSAITLIIAGTMMYFTKCLMKSFFSGIVFFTGGLLLLDWLIPK